MICMDRYRIDFIPPDAQDYSLNLTFIWVSQNHNYSIWLCQVKYFVPHIPEITNGMPSFALGYVFTSFVA